ncbi:mitochondrial glycoprotein [Mycena galericulata]|nr:mitochondrial glycoprotein [Mycena galericulata]
MSAARTLRQLTTVSSRLSARQLSTVSLRWLPQAATKIPAATRAFSVTSRALKAGSSDVALSQKLAEELKYENEARESAEEPEFLTSFQSQGIWKIQDTPGSNEVIITRQFGNENIRLVFSVSDLQNDEEPQEEFDDETEEGDTPPEDAPAQGTGSIIRAVVSISKTTGAGALDVDMTVQNGQFLIENISYYADAALSHESSVEADWKRRGLYIGPEFSTLDLTVQENFEKFLEERDIGEATAFFIPEYAEYKEQREYVQWLENVKKFVDA